ncbi:MAG: hypothetical protein FJ290_01235 [Planctomycetes bacterium]|nr:hypothetical protein [Planctomycetota bacterium]
MANLKACLAESGLLLISPVCDRDQRTAFYVRLRSFPAFERELAGLALTQRIPFRGATLLAFRKR